MAERKMILGNLLHLSYNMWGDWKNPKMGPHWAAQPVLRFDEALWNELLEKMARAGMNMVMIDLGDGIQYRSHPEIAVQGAWSEAKLREELKKLRGMGLEPIPKLNFSTCHDQWLGEYARMVSTRPYYQVCKDLIAEVIELFDGPRFFHLGMDEEEVHHQENFQFVVERKGDLWWHDVEFFVEQVESKKVRAWVWADYVWNHKEIFYQRMSKKVLQSNWYRHPVSGPAKSVYGHIHNEDIPAAMAYVELDRAGYDQVPAISNWETPENIYETVRWCKQRLSKDRLLGYLLTPWRPTLAATRERHVDAIEHFAKAIKEM